LLVKALVLTAIDPIFVFTDAATSPQACVAVGVFLCLKKRDMDLLMGLTPNQLAVELASKVSYKILESKKSTWSEIKTVIHAIESIDRIQEYSNTSIEIYTDCQSICDLLGRRKEKLEKNNFNTQAGAVLKNAELYKELYFVTSRLQINVFKIKGHQVNSNMLSIQEKIFGILDKLSRKKLRSIMNHSS